MLKKKNITIIIIIGIAIGSSFFIGQKSGVNTTTPMQKDELKIPQEKYKLEKTKIQKNCRPGVNSKHTNFVVGYGSLMNKDSRIITVPEAEYASPILVKNFERIWASRGKKSGATFLLAIPNKDYVMNAIYYKATSSDIASTDLREASYCRVEIPRKDLLPLGVKSLPKGDYWMYVKEFADAEFPTRDFPILQSYADVFMTGCLQTQMDFNLTEFGQLCFNTTYNWDLANWLYDRTNPQYARYSKNTEKYRPQIDGIIHRLSYEDDPL